MRDFNAAAYSGIPVHAGILGLTTSGTENFFAPMCSRFEIQAVRRELKIFPKIFSACLSDPTLVQWSVDAQQRS
jgi:hypothetical protein